MSGQYELRDGEYGTPNKIIRFADMEEDGHQDMMITGYHKSSGKSHTLILQNSPCSSSFYDDLGGKFNSFSLSNCRMDLVPLIVI